MASPFNSARKVATYQLIVNNWARNNGVILSKYPNYINVYIASFCRIIKGDPINTSKRTFRLHLIENQDNEKDLKLNGYAANTTAINFRNCDNISIISAFKQEKVPHTIIDDCYNCQFHLYKSLIGTEIINSENIIIFIHGHVPSIQIDGSVHVTIRFFKSLLNSFPLPVVFLSHSFNFLVQVVDDLANPPTTTAHPSLIQPRDYE
ncbi:hypothetical protein RFI_04640 [Reticulomyxa filosa]|uniref:C-CAP/cofactor C-like domain-containing protein n=1 Tax=Reticulomyxa filosa TaxID=46433 RepID=X6P2W5_RETFI|nr:hypothetical protein RFI_04640 [Reticulomyxa filosa]|eukprot:ETO32478.1 hypothetical protein RFI_04640 [Reticulomyxa filosa]